MLLDGELGLLILRGHGLSLQFVVSGALVDVKLYDFFDIEELALIDLRAHQLVLVHSVADLRLRVLIL